MKKVYTENPTKTRLGKKGKNCVKVQIVDALMGKGKTSAMINQINNSSKNKKFLYITPYLNEVERIIEKCPSKRFRQPETYGTKIRGIKQLFKQGANIVSTHSLFKSFDEEIIELIRKSNYTLIMDEVIEVIQQMEVSKDDLDILFERYIKVTDNNLLKWITPEYKGLFNDFKKLCELDCIGVYNDSVVFWLFPIHIFEAFKDVYILTYLFEAQIQKYYFEFYDIKTKNMYIKGDNISNYSITDKVVKYNYCDYKKLIRICDSDALNKIGDARTALSVSWYEKNKENDSIEELKKNIVNYYKNYSKTESKYNMWTTFKDYQSMLKGKGYTKGFLTSNMRATNDYSNKTAIAYLVNKFLNPNIKNFLLKNNIEVDEDKYALSEMIQFIWRSAIRENKKIDVYIPSSRMRLILEKWIEDNSQ